MQWYGTQAPYDAIVTKNSNTESTSICKGALWS
ncbi:phage upper tail fiber protein [Gordonia sp. Z-3]